MRARGRGRDPLCPFCGEFFGRPSEVRTKLGNVITGGRCKCGAAYIYDRTGRNLGEAYVDGLVFACNDDWDMAWSLAPDEDYKMVPMCYDESSHMAIGDPGQGGRAQENMLFFKLMRREESSTHNDK